VNCIIDCYPNRRFKSLH